MKKILLSVTILLTLVVLVINGAMASNMPSEDTPSGTVYPTDAPTEPWCFLYSTCTPRPTSTPTPTFVYIPPQTSTPMPDDPYPAPEENSGSLLDVIVKIFLPFFSKN